jgi:hypothetical protein
MTLNQIGVEILVPSLLNVVNEMHFEVPISLIACYLPLTFVVSCLLMNVNQGGFVAIHPTPRTASAICVLNH